ncbi:MAG: hypothetical protein Q8R55_07255 [Candidatus Taylorbacteria bacterium]|nr:hypothetical protein [Candidatus Taylorbacteria bacterium]
MAKLMDDGVSGVILETRWEVVSGLISGWFIFFGFLPFAVLFFTYRIISYHITSSVVVGILVGIISILVATVWIREIRKDYKDHMDLFRSLPWRKQKQSKSVEYRLFQFALFLFLVSFISIFFF